MVKVNQKGFTLIELLIVVAIIGILVGILIPNLLDAVDRAKQRATIADIHYWGLAVSAFHAEKSVFPVPNGGYGSGGPANAAVITQLVPYSINQLMAVDHWKQPIFYYADESTTYTVSSYGKDGIAAFDCTPINWHDYRCDMRLTDGVFEAAP